MKKTIAQAWTKSQSEKEAKWLGININIKYNYYINKMKFKWHQDIWKKYLC